MKQTRNLLRIAIFNISYIRGLFPEKYFNDKSVPALGKLFLVLSSLSLSLSLSKIQISINDFLWNNDLIFRDEDQKAHADGCRVSQTHWLDGKRHVYRDPLDLKENLHIYQCVCVIGLLIYAIFAGVYDALQKKYLKTLLFCICEAIDGPMLEEYACKLLIIFIWFVILDACQILVGRWEHSCLNTRS